VTAQRVRAQGRRFQSIWPRANRQQFHFARLGATPGGPGCQPFFDEVEKALLGLFLPTAPRRGRSWPTKRRVNAGTTSGSDWWAWINVPPRLPVAQCSEPPAGGARRRVPTQ
jgi:hypothetical protein